MRVCAPDWNALTEELKLVDPANPRIDAVAVCESARMGAEIHG